MTQKLTIDYTLTDEEFECILEMAGYGCNYWADEMDIADDYKSVTFHDCEGEKSYTINKDDVEKAIVKIAKCEGEIGLHVTNRHLVYQYIIDNDQTVCDSDMADWIIQTTIFGECIYG